MNILRLEEFVGLYVDSMLKFKNGKAPERDTDPFYTQVFQDVSAKTGILPEHLKYLYNPFHWAIFSDKRGNVKSINPLKYGEGRQQFFFDSLDERTAAIAYILGNYKTLLETRLEIIRKLEG